MKSGQHAFRSDFKCCAVSASGLVCGPALVCRSVEVSIPAQDKAVRLGAVRALRCAQKRCKSWLAYPGE